MSVCVYMCVYVYLCLYAWIYAGEVLVAEQMWSPSICDGEHTIVSGDRSERAPHYVCNTEEIFLQDFLTKIRKILKRISTSLIVVTKS